MKRRFMVRERAILLIIFGILAICLFSKPVCFAETDISSVVFTFDPPVVANINKSDALFKTLKQIMGSRNQYGSLSSIIENDGASWSLSRNFSGIQLAIIYPDMNERVIELSYQLFSRLEKSVDKIINATPTNRFIEKLLGQYPSNKTNEEHASISIATFGAATNYTEELRQAVLPAFRLYEKKSTSDNGFLPVIPSTKPAIIKLFKWNEVSSSSFFSAKFLGEKFSKEMSAPHEPRYEIIFQQNEIGLFLIADGTEAQLFKFHPKLEECWEKIADAKQLSDWNQYSQGAKQILIEDSRDLTKNFLQTAWINHWNGSPFDENKNIKYMRPSSVEQIISMPSQELHWFSRSGRTFPRIAAARSSGEARISDIAMKIIAEKRILDEIVKILEQGNSLSFPVSKERNSPQSMTLQFHANNEQIVRIISSLRAKILNSLALKNLINDLPAELSISIAGTSDVPPFLLRGWIQQGWPSDPAAYAWREASKEDIAEILGMKVSDKASLLRKWALKTVTGKGKAEILVELISRNLFINSFTID